jgi:hypothetical protein
MHAFWSWAQAIRAGDWLGRDTYHPYFGWMREMAPLETWHRWWGGAETFHQAPLYPYFVALVAGATGASTPAPVIALQLALGALQPLVLYALVRRVAGPREGLVAAALGAVYAPFVFQQGVLLRDWLPPLVEPLALVLLLRAADTDWRRDWVAAGACAGAAVLVRETALLLVPAIGLWLLWLRWPATRATATSAALLALGFGLAFFPLVARNLAVGAPALALSNRGGATFVQHNAADSLGLWSERNPHTERAILEWADGDGRAVVFATLQTYQGDYGAFAAKIARKLRAALDPIEIPSNVSFAYGRELSPVLRALPGFGLVLPLGAVGLALALRSWRRHLLLILYAGVVVASIAVSLPLARYRLPLAIVAIAYAGIAVAALADAARGRRREALAIAAAIATVALVQRFVLAVPELRSSGWMAMYGAGVEHRTAAAIYRADGDAARAAEEIARLRARVTGDPWTEEVARAAALENAAAGRD